VKSTGVADLTAGTPQTQIFQQVWARRQSPLRHYHTFMALLLLLPLLACLSLPAAAAPRVYETRGTIQSFGPERRFACIHHDTSPGYTEAMTMSFEAGQPEQLAPFHERQRASFPFSDEDGRRIIRSIQVAPEP